MEWLGSDQPPFFPNDVAEKLLGALEDPRRPTAKDDMPVSRSLKQALASAAKIAQERDSKTIEPLHLPPTIVEERERGLAQLLREHGVTRQKVAKALTLKPLRVTIAHTKRRGGTSHLTFTSNRNLRFLLAALVSVGMMLAVSASRAFAQAATDAPTKREIASAYRSRSGEDGTAIPGLRWERWRIKQDRGSLHFERISEERHIGVIIAKYRAVAKKRNVCLEYEITDTIILHRRTCRSGRLWWLSH